MTQYGFFFDQSRCYGCQACATACKDWNNIAPGPEKWMTVYEWETGAFPLTRLHTLAFSCGHCEHPACISACPEGAILKEEQFGAVLVDGEKCVGCRECAKACPYGAPKFASDREGETMSKCTMCIDKLIKGDQPQCALACPMRALDFGPLVDLVAKYGDGRALEGMPDTSELKPAMVFKAMAERKELVPFDVGKIIELNANRGDLPRLFEEGVEVTEIPEGIVLRNDLKMKHSSADDLMRATRNDLG
ncbi:4Fe-4S dicluster domain-containing protein [Raoultibacter phocaeensis]|uniref:4Fe-4S dicluster domain-containing protein n=1 Tax=Raoultibacter phocaeensis TaxID=2479841 RepID=UPI001117CE32|nr:4Fe-4S dicluster domain-containing protein [Raoultibacter phocaeensis]